MTKTPQIVVVGGGTGSFVVASGLRKQPVDVTVILTMVDDGGSNKTLRDAFGLLPTSGIRQAIVALSENQTMLRKLFTYRYSKGGESLKGMTFGNLFMAAMADIMGSQKAGIEETCKLLQVKGHILPASYDDVRLVATYEDGTQVTGEHLIDEPVHDGTMRIVKLETKPVAKISAEAKEALRNADLIILGPGDFYTNTVANLVVEGMAQVLTETSAKIMFITNLMTKYGETYNYTLKNFIEDLGKYLSPDQLDYVLINNNIDFNQEALDIYQTEHQIPIADDLEQDDIPNSRIVRADMLSRVTPKVQAGDVLARSMIRHDPERLAWQIYKIIQEDIRGV